jgi:hypothetical protein
MKKQNGIQQTIDFQLNEWRKKINKEVPERVGLIFYTNEKGETEVEVYFADDNMWLSQATLGELFDVEEHTKEKQHSDDKCTLHKLRPIP